MFIAFVLITIRSGIIKRSSETNKLPLSILLTILVLADFLFAYFFNIPYIVILAILILTLAVDVLLFILFGKYILKVIKNYFRA